VKYEEIEIVVIEDEEDILELIEYHLSNEGYAVTGFHSTENVKRFIEEESPALLLVDRNLPGVEGSEFVRQIRDEGYSIPVIFLTAKEKLDEMEQGFESGGDDYITKPFQFKELLMRVKALLRRSGAMQEERIVFRDIRLYPARKEVEVGGRRVALTHLEFQLLYVFVKNPTVALEREYLRDEVWGGGGENFHDKTINVAINRLKKKIDPDGSKNYFTPVWGVGYRLG
jgi:DNA-binding response OmpR family regulator